MSNTLTEFELELREWDDAKLAQALDNLNVQRDHKRLYTGVQKLAIRAEASRRLRWGRKAEAAEFKSYRVEVQCFVDARNEDEARDNVEAVLQGIIHGVDTGITFTFEMLDGAVEEIGS